MMTAPEIKERIRWHMERISQLERELREINNRKPKD